MHQNRLTKVENNGIEWITKDYIEQKKHKRLYNKKFRKCFDELLIIYSYLTGSEPKVLSHILINCNKLNQYSITYDKLASKLNLSKVRLKEIMRKLQKFNVVKNIGGIIYVNPYMFVKDGNKEETLQIEYIKIFKRDNNE